MFITFGFGQYINGYDLGNHFMRITEDEIPNVIEKLDGFYIFAFRYEDVKLEEMLSTFDIKEITIQEYLDFKNSGD